MNTTITISPTLNHVEQRVSKIRSIYALLVSSLFSDDDPECKFGEGYRDDTIWLNRLVGKTFKIDISHLSDQQKKWYTDKGFEIVSKSILKLSWDNYNKVIDFSRNDKNNNIWR
jgi:hypothetical protein